MLTVQYDHYGPPEVLHMKDIPVPAITRGLVLVRVIASSVNGADITVRSGKLKLFSGKNFPKGTGFDFTGTVAETGPDVTEFKTGDEVWGFINGLKKEMSGATAEYVLASENEIAKRPLTIDGVSAAALPGAGGAALCVIRDHAKLMAGERILIRGAAGGVGTAAVQMAKAIGAHVTALVGKQNIEKVKSIGADEAFDYRAIDPASIGKFNVIMDLVGKGMRDYRRLLTQDGRMLALAFGGFIDTAHMLASVVYGKRRIKFVQAPPDSTLLSSLTEYVNAGKLAPVIDSFYAIDDAAGAHRSLEAGGGFGKRVIRIT